MCPMKNRCYFLMIVVSFLGKNKDIEIYCDTNHKLIPGDGTMIKRFVQRYGLFVSALFITVLAFSGFGSAADFSADVVMTSSMGTMKGKVFFKDGNSRREMRMGGQQQITIYRKDKEVVWMLMPQQRMYMEMSSTRPGKMAPVDPGQMEKMGKKELLGKEKINGYMCLKYRYTPNDASSGPATYWISEKLNFPIKIEMNDASEHMVMEYKNIREGTLSSALFNIPSGYRKMSMPAMPNMPRQ